MPELNPQGGSPVHIDRDYVRTLVPLKDMSEAHLDVLLAQSPADFLYAGQSLFNHGAVDHNHLYLLYGDLQLERPDGSVFTLKGRSSLLPIAPEQPRRYTAVAATDCAVLRVDSQALDELLTWSQVADYLHTVIARERDLDEDEQWMMQVLHSNLFFKVPPLNVEAIFDRMSPRVVEKGAVIIRQGELGDRCYFIKEGEAEVTRQGPVGVETLAAIGPGRCFGEDALVDDAPRNANVTMTTDGVLMSLDKQDFYRLLRAPAINRIAREALSEDMVVVDVRSDEEYAQGHYPGAVNVPLHLLGIKSRLLKFNVHYVCYCNTGRRSAAATHLLAEQGYQVCALEDCQSLMEQGPLESDTNYVLRGGRAEPGQ